MNLIKLFSPKLRRARSRLYRRKQASKQVRSVFLRKEKRPTPISSSKYSLESSRRDLHNALLCTVLVGSVWVKKYTKINTVL